MSTKAKFLTCFQSPKGRPDGHRSRALDMSSQHGCVARLRAIPSDRRNRAVVPRGSAYLYRHSVSWRNMHVYAHTYWSVHIHRARVGRRTTQSTDRNSARAPTRPLRKAAPWRQRRPLRRAGSHLGPQRWLPPNSTRPKSAPQKAMPRQAYHVVGTKSQRTYATGGSLPPNTQGHSGRDTKPNRHSAPDLRRCPLSSAFYSPGTTRHNLIATNRIQTLIQYYAQRTRSSIIKNL